MSKAEANRKWSDEHRVEIAEYNKAYYDQKKDALKEKRRDRYHSDPKYREQAIARAKMNRECRRAEAEAKAKTKGKTKK